MQTWPEPWAGKARNTFRQIAAGARWKNSTVKSSTASSIPGKSKDPVTSARVLPRKPRIFLLTPCFVPHDAVGNDVYGMWQLLRAGGYDVRILAEEIHQ